MRIGKSCAISMIFGISFATIYIKLVVRLSWGISDPGMTRSVQALKPISMGRRTPFCFMQKQIVPPSMSWTMQVSVFYVSQGGPALCPLLRRGN